MGKKALAAESPHPKEDFFINDIIQVISESLRKKYRNGLYNRRLHAKSEGLLEARFTVMDTLPDYLRKGLFKTPKTYNAWVRFSNASFNIEPDGRRGVRGLSLKVVGTGEAPLEADALGQTQDFLLTNNAIVYPGTVATQHLALRFLFVSKLYLFCIFLRDGLHGFFTFLKGAIKIPHFLGVTYYSATPYLFGEGQAVKWRATPAEVFQIPMPENPGVDFLRERLADDASKKSFAFDWCIQRQEDTKTQPIEDAAVLWKTPFEKVATLLILQQDMNTPERKQLEETIVFSPWHCLAAHRPLGGINRLRRQVYKALAARRQQHNKTVEPLT